MTVFIKKFFSFLLFSAVTYIIILFIWGTFMPSYLTPNLNYVKGSYGHTYTRLQDVKDYENIDILFLGSSHTYRGFDNRIFNASGLKTFNLGSSAQTPLQTITLLKRHLTRLSPKLVIYDVYPNTFMGDGVESSLDIISNEKNDLNSVKMALSVNHLKVYNTLIYAFLRDIFDWRKNFKESLVKGDDNYVKGGFVEKELAYYKTKTLLRKEIKFDSTQLDAFNECLRLLEKNKISVILVYVPIAPSNYSRYTNIREFDSVMSAHMKYFNFNEKLILNDSLHFYDPDHLNQNGVKLFNNKLIEILNEEKFNR
ncbi:hypothetical protein HSX10_05555 [Winogradskyella undariae]|uniref:hypothetical protein n=1 Tax=Winogradskyella TaxID=286104 RepID=UPI00156BA8A3|nr:MULTISPECIES: hypothetical protein [Winogradskyella]NRR91025.1 hypothetical protein [Winogradskyella undariae]QXP80026.1 hypothetical protein H0I32_05170 [Winogradskyella sp. HaHa_3_26]